MNIDNIIMKINDLFKNIPNIQKQTSTLISRTSHVSMIDVFRFLLKYSQKYITKSSIVSDFNFDDNIEITQSSLHSKEKHITVECCKQISSQLYNILNDLYTKYPIMKIIEKKINSSHISINDINIDTHVFIGIDATCSNKYKNHELITDNVLYFFDLNKKIPINFTNTSQPYFQNNKNNKSNKNHEVKTLIFYLQKHHNELKNMFKGKVIVLVCDRAYHSIELFELCEKYKIKYVIRVKDNCNIFNNKKSNNPNIIKYRNNEKIRKITTVHMCEDYVELDDKQSIKLKIPIECNLISNLEKNKIFTDKIIEDIYLARWNIEIFFKNSKNTTKLSLSTTKTDESYEKQKYLNFIVAYLARIIIFMYYAEKYKNNEKNILKEINDQNVNYTNIVHGIYLKLVNILCRGELTPNIIQKFIKSYVLIIICKKDRKFKRKGMIPGTKWYLKKYSDEAATKKICAAILNDTINNLNKNLKSLANKYINMGKKYTVNILTIIKK